MIRLRLRILDGCNARNYRLAISDGKPFDLVSLPVVHQPIMRPPPFDRAHGRARW